MAKMKQAEEAVVLEIQAGMLEVARDLERQRRRLAALGARGEGLPGFVQGDRANYVVGHLRGTHTYEVIATCLVEAGDGDLPKAIECLRRYGRITPAQWTREEDRADRKRARFERAEAAKRARAAKATPLREACSIAAKIQAGVANALHARRHEWAPKDRAAIERLVKVVTDTAEILADLAAVRPAKAPGRRARRAA